MYSLVIDSVQLAPSLDHSVVIVSYVVSPREICLPSSGILIGSTVFAELTCVTNT